MGQSGGWFWFIGIKIWKTGTNLMIDSYWERDKNILIIKLAVETTTKQRFQ